jgi:SAM-dependent methyltransferase
MTTTALTSAQSRYTDYDRWAWLYNQTMGPRYCENQFPQLEQLLLPHLPSGASILDLCCGTGHVAQQLHHQGYRVIGLDGSEEMLTYARQNAPEVEFILDDARVFNLSTPVDAAFSISSSLNHVTSLEELKAVFANVYAALSDKGLFLFDLGLKGRYQNLPLLEGEITDDYAWAIGETYDTEQQAGTFKVTMFRPEGNGWQRSDLVYPVKDYDWKEIHAALEATGFTQIHVYDRTGQPTNPEENATVYFVCQKGATTHE